MLGPLGTLADAPSTPASSLALPARGRPIPGTMVLVDDSLEPLEPNIPWQEPTIPQPSDLDGAPSESEDPGRPVESQADHPNAPLARVAEMLLVLLALALTSSTVAVVWRELGNHWNSV